MANFEHSMTADNWTKDELIDNLRLAGEACDERRKHFISNAPSGTSHAAWKRHALAVAAAVRLLEFPD